MVVRKRCTGRSWGVGERYLRLGRAWSCIIAGLVLLVLVDACTAMATTTPPEPRAGEVTTVEGRVISGGDTTPPDLADAPRKFRYRIEREDGSVVNVAYTAYPPGPAGDQARAKVRLDFHAGTIQVGDYLKARGTYDESANLLVVAGEGDYIETYPKKP